MEIIFTTATSAEKLKRRAKTLRKTTGTSLAVALDAVARQQGYEHWKHVAVCLEQKDIAGRVRPLPESLRDLLDQAAAGNPASTESVQAFAQGLAFAMDVKDAEELLITSEYSECDDAWYLAARDLLPRLVHYRDVEEGSTLFDAQSPKELASTALDDLQNYRLFRYLGAVAPASLEAAYKQISALSFFPPTHIWLSGKFIDVGEIPEIRVDGQAVLSNVPGFTVLSSSEKLTRFEKFGHLLNTEERALFDTMTAMDQDFLLFQLEKKTPAGQVRYRPLQTSLSSSWQGAEKT